MSDNNNNTSFRGIGFGGLLTLVFIVLKLCGVITWSWVWVLSPMWISAIIVIVLIVVLLVLNAIKD